jgi:predicted nucleic acid-binding protein
MPYLVDSNVVINHLADVPEASQLLNRLAADGIVISIITYMEAFQGVARSPQPEEAHDKFQAFTKSVLILPFSFGVAERCARLRETLRRQNRRVKFRPLDLIIAATALEYGLTLVTKILRTSTISRILSSISHAHRVRRGSRKSPHRFQSFVPTFLYCRAFTAEGFPRFTGLIRTGMIGLTQSTRCYHGMTDPAWISPFPSSYCYLCVWCGAMNVNKRRFSGLPSGFPRVIPALWQC